jgi:hypothetical protein
MYRIHPTPTFLKSLKISSSAASSEVTTPTSTKVSSATKVTTCSSASTKVSACSSAKVSSALSLLALIPTLIARLIFALLFP